jgi:hypothetical protein
MAGAKSMYSSRVYDNVRELVSPVVLTIRADHELLFPNPCSLSDKATQPWSRPAKNSCIPPPAQETGILAVLLEIFPSGPRMWSESSVATTNCRSFGGSCLSSLWAAITQSREGLWCFLLSRPLIAVSGIDDRLHRRWTRPGQTLRGRVNRRAREPPKVLLKPPPNE